MNDLLCRLCLNTENLIPIFESSDEHYSDILATITGLQIHINDGLPQLVCRACQHLIQYSITLRNQSQATEAKLLQMGYIRQTTSMIFHKEILKQVMLLPNKDNKDIEEQNSDDNDHFNNFNTENPELEQRFAIESQNGSFEVKINSESVLSEKKSPRKEKRDMYLKLVDGRLDPNGPVKCNVCKKIVNKWPSFVCHAKLHLGFNYVCEYCGKCFISSTQLNRHCRSYHGMRRELCCKHCNYLALDKPQLILHERRMHTGERPFGCDHCGASYYSRRCLIQHIESHQTHTNVQCQKCPQMFKSRRHLARHTYSAHTSKEYTYKCPICNQIYRNYKYIRVHMKKQHGCTSKDAQIIKIKL